jgi:Leucine-rich repeat (LRR) protein
MLHDYSDKGLKFLPDLPNVKELYCQKNHLKFLPNLPNVEVLWCHNNKFRFLPVLPNVKELCASNNKLKSYKDFLNIKLIDFSGNKIKDFSRNVSHRLEYQNKYLKKISTLKINTVEEKTDMKIYFIILICFIIMIKFVK